MPESVDGWDQFVQVVRMLSNNLPKHYTDRIEFELCEMNKQGVNNTWIEYYNNKSKFDRNPNSLLIPWVLGMITTGEDPMATRKSELLTTTNYDDVVAYVSKHGSQPHDFIKDNDVPDIDIDCLPSARDRIKEYAIERYGDGTDLQNLQVCSVGTWQTYKFKMAIQDAITAHGVMHRKEVEKVTTMLPDDLDNLKPGGLASCKGMVPDSDGKQVECGHKHNIHQCPKCGSEITDAPTLGRLLRENEELRKLFKEYPRIIIAASRMVGRIRAMGMHAGALIIADSKLLGKVPLGKTKADGQWVTMWSEGSNQQLSKCGYVKWDILGLKTLEYMYDTCNAISQNRGINFGQPLKEYRVKMKCGTEFVLYPDTLVNTPSGPKKIKDVVLEMQAQHPAIALAG